MPFMDNRYVTLEAIFFAVFTDSLSRFKEIFSFEIIEEVDEFTKERKICFSVVGFPKPHLFKFYGNAAGYRTPHKYISFSYYFGFQIENVSGSDFIIFRFDKEFRLSEGDTINFLFDNQEILKFEITGKPFTIYRNSTKGFKLPLFVEDIELFKSNSVVKTRVHFKEENFWSEFSRGNNNVAEKDFQYVIQQMFFLYANEIKERINDYKPLSRLDEVPVEIRKSDFCYVYLMEDKANNFFKIGISNKPDFREKTLQSEKPSIEMVCFKKYPTRRMAESFEKALHRSFKDKHIRGEWFNLSVDEINEIVETLK
jgi:hypothetical protein